MNDKTPIINCHTHIFTADHVPPFLAKTFIPSPFHFLLPLKPIVAFFRWWYRGPADGRYSKGYKRLQKIYTGIMAFLIRLYPVNILLGYYVFFFAFFLLYRVVLPAFPPEETWISKVIHKGFVMTERLFPDIENKWLAILLIIIVFIFFETIRNFIFLIAGFLWKALGKLSGKQTKEMFSRYLNIGRYAFHKKQNTILSKLKSQYPEGTGFIILPMDMDFMEAGNSKTRYRDQMEELVRIRKIPTNKDILFPFVFADPRRMVPAEKENRYRKGDKDFFSWTGDKNSVNLSDCFMKDLLETNDFSGIKIYPALGYYPFDEKLLPLWKYAADNSIPILTHCIRGTIFYRGQKRQEWNRHPVFEQAMGAVKHKEFDGLKNDEQLENEKASYYEPLVLSQFNNVDFSINFTHPLNYLCLLEEELLRKVISASTDEKLREVFGYNGPDEPLLYNLSHLKICLGHFGGEDEWKKYFEMDRYNFSSQLAKYPDTGINFFKTTKGKPSKGTPEQLWKYTDWYSIICSMMLQYPGVYADISYILHGDQDIMPLLKQTLKNPKLKQKVLYGTDFFVVRNHKSDKQMLADMMGGLTFEEFNQIARINPKEYLSKK